MPTQFENMGLNNNFENQVIHEMSHEERVKATILVHKTWKNAEIRDELIDMLGLITAEERQKEQK